MILVDDVEAMKCHTSLLTEPRETDSRQNSLLRVGTHTLVSCVIQKHWQGHDNVCTVRRPFTDVSDGFEAVTK